MRMNKKWILVPALMIAASSFLGTNEAKADVRVTPTWGGLTISFGNSSRNCRPAPRYCRPAPRYCPPTSSIFHRYESLFRYTRPSCGSSVRQSSVFRYPRSIGSRSRANCDPRSRRSR